MYQYFLPFYGWIICHCIYRPHVFYPFINFRAFECFYLWFIWIEMLWTVVYKFWFGHLFSVLLGIHLGVGHIVILCLTQWGTSVRHMELTVNSPFGEEETETQNVLNYHLYVVKSQLFNFCPQTLHDLYTHTFDAWWTFLPGYLTTSQINCI